MSGPEIHERQRTRGTVRKGQLGAIVLLGVIFGICVKGETYFSAQCLIF